MSLTDSAGAARRLADQACAAVNDLAEVARELEADSQAALLTSAEQRLRDEAFRLMLLGRFNNGKSTLVNALIGRTGEIDLADGLTEGIVPMGDDPTTPTLISVEYADDPFVETTGVDGTVKQWTLDDFRTEFVLDSDEKTNENRFGAIASCRIGLPAELCKERVILFDTPGVADSMNRDDVARAALAGCDAALVVYSLNSPYGHDEIAYDTLARQEHTRVFTIVNTFGKDVTDVKLRNAWNKLVEPRTGEAYAGQDLTGHDIFFVDALQALNGRAQREEALVEKSGLAALEDRLGTFLLRERHQHHINRFVEAANTQAATLERLLAKRSATAETPDHSLARDLADLEPALAAIRQRAQGVEPLVRRACRSAASDVKDSFGRLMFEVERELPRQLLNAPLASWRDGTFAGMLNVFHQKALADEVAEFARAHTAKRVTSWRDTAQEIVTEHLERAATEAHAELSAMERSYDDVYGSFTGWTPGPVTGAPPTSAAERWGSAFVGTILSGGPVGVVAGAGGGRKAVLAGIGGQIGAGVGLAMLGFGAPVVIPAAAIAGLAAALGFGRLTREKLVEAFERKGLPELIDQFREYDRTLEAEVKTLFDGFGAHLNEQVAALVLVEEKNFAKAEELARADQETRERELGRLRLLRQRVDADRGELELVQSSAAYELLDES